ncbi:hypothetical protein KK120_08700 [Virgibacillus dakarensis]|nr:hypothetical protein [Virgibacillus dakarensis]MBT2215900.1 hypothetical protein [Virgibacillus dakarensis]
MVIYPIEESLSDTPGIYHYEFIVRYPDGRKETFPNDGYLKLSIKNEVR